MAGSKTWMVRYPPNSECNSDPEKWWVTIVNSDTEPAGNCPSAIITLISDTPPSIAPDVKIGDSDYEVDETGDEEWEFKVDSQGDTEPVDLEITFHETDGSFQHFSLEVYFPAIYGEFALNAIRTGGGAYSFSGQQIINSFTLSLLNQIPGGCRSIDGYKWVKAGSRSVEKRLWDNTLIWTVDVGDTFFDMVHVPPGNVAFLVGDGYNYVELGRRGDVVENKTLDIYGPSHTPGGASRYDGGTYSHYLYYRLLGADSSGDVIGIRSSEITHYEVIGHEVPDLDHPFWHQTPIDQQIINIWNPKTGNIGAELYNYTYIISYCVAF